MKSAAKLILNALPGLKSRVEELTKSQVLVGVPREDTTRKSNEKKGPMNNATLAYIHDKGSPAANIPARPFMVPGIKAVQPRVAQVLKTGAQAVLQGAPSGMPNALHKAGLIAQASIRGKINEGIPPPLAPSTLAARRRRGRKGEKPLVDTGQLRNSINYVIRTK